MTHIQTQITTQSPVKKAFDKVSMMMFLFAAVLAILLVLSWYFVLPRFTTIEVSGKSLSFAHLISNQAKLKADILEAQEKRDELVTAGSDAQYDALKVLKSDTLSLQELHSHIRKVAAESSDQPDAVHVDSLKYSRETKTLEIRGDVRFVGPRSQTVLAQFVEKIAELSFVESVDTPRFEREEDATIGFHSPFSFTATLK